LDPVCQKLLTDPFALPQGIVINRGELKKGKFTHVSAPGDCAKSKR
jgi:hypothetical protein